MTAFPRRLIAGFTLIELLIVVAIIAILAAIAVPNFLEAQTRSKVSRTASDMRSIRTALESYRIDNNFYPETDIGVEDPKLAGVGMIRITTPIAYMTSIPGSPFDETKMGYSGTPKNANKYKIYLYTRAKYSPGLAGDGPSTQFPEYFQTYVSDRALYMLADPNSLANATAIASVLRGEYMLKSVGPNNIDDRSVTPLTAKVYDPTNGTVSAGDVIVFSDTQGFAQPR